MRLLRLDSLLDSASADFIEIYEDFPSHAILSHTWENEEISYRELQSPTEFTCSKKGYLKLLGFAKLATEQGYKYGWMDTCCIDKSDPTELSEAINSMFRWYQRASACFVYLSDIDNLTCSADPDRYNALARCKWFSRGWTLQELIAPRSVGFYTRSWEILDHKDELADVISQITQIDTSLLKDERKLDSFAIAERMSWASERKTTRPEDVAYSLLGIFNINMPLLYGEGATNAFLRLQEEIVKKSNDHSILGWETPTDRDWHGSSVFAPSPQYFPTGEKSLQINGAASFAYNRTPYMMTNMGLRIRLPLICKNPGQRTFWVVLDCHDRENSDAPICVPLRAVSDDERTFQRENLPNRSLSHFLGRPCTVCEIFLQHDSMASSESYTMQGESEWNHTWTTDQLEREDLWNATGMAGTQREGFDLRTFGHEFGVSMLALLWLLCTLFPEILAHAMPPSSHVTWYMLNLILTTYLCLSFITGIVCFSNFGLGDMFRDLGQFATTRLIDMIGSEEPQNHDEERKPPEHITINLSQNLRNWLKSLQLPTDYNTSRWQNAGKIVVIEDKHSFFSRHGPPFVSLLGYTKIPTLAILLSRWIHGLEWSQFGWIYVTTAILLSLLVDILWLPFLELVMRYAKADWLILGTAEAYFNAKPGAGFLAWEFRKVRMKQNRSKLD